MSTPKPQCTYCLKLTDSIKRCGKCGHASYCSRECQVADWKKHKGVCKDAAKQSAQVKQVFGTDFSQVMDKFRKKYNYALALMAKSCIPIPQIPLLVLELHAAYDADNGSNPIQIKSHNITPLEVFRHVHIGLYDAIIKLSDSSRKSAGGEVYSYWNILLHVDVPGSDGPVVRICCQGTGDTPKDAIGAYIAKINAGESISPK
jgi:MYND finger